MKQGRSLVELATEIQRQKETKKDYIVNTNIMHVGLDGSLNKQIKLIFKTPEKGKAYDECFSINDLAHRQFGQKLNIPAKYYDYMRNKAPQLLADNVNHWLHSQPEHRLLRTLDGNLRHSYQKGMTLIITILLKLYYQYYLIWMFR